MKTNNKQQLDPSIDPSMTSRNDERASAPPLGGDSRAPKGGSCPASDYSSIAFPYRGEESESRSRGEGYWLDVGTLADPTGRVWIPVPTLTLHLPWPPSVNRYWRSVAGRVLISAEGRKYRSRIAAMLAGLTPRCDRLALAIHACPPDKRRRDLDNLLKAPLDALQHAGAYADDCQIDHLTIRRGPPCEGGRLTVVITTAPTGEAP